MGPENLINDPLSQPRVFSPVFRLNPSLLPIIWPPEAASLSTVSPAHSYIQTVFAANATEIISTSLPSLAKPPGLCRRGWSWWRGGWELGCPQQGWSPPQNISCSSNSVEGIVGTAPHYPVEGEAELEGPGVLTGSLATCPLT